MSTKITLILSCMAIIPEDVPGQGAVARQTTFILGLHTSVEGLKYIQRHDTDVLGLSFRFNAVTIMYSGGRTHRF